MSDIHNGVWFDSELSAHFYGAASLKFIIDWNINRPSNLMHYSDTR